MDLSQYIEDERLNIMLRDALQELGNIGVAHSATALSQILNRKVDMSVPRVALVPIEDMYKRITGAPDELVTAIATETVNGGKMDILMVMDENSTRALLSVLRSGEIPDLANLTDLDKEILVEVGNIIILHCVSAVNTFTGLSLYPLPPSIAVDMVNAILQHMLLKDGVYKTHVISVEVDIFTENSSIKGIVFMFPDHRELDSLMNQLYGEGWDEI